MAESWKTKWGARRVRHDPPTLAEAVAAAACLTEDRQRQAEIAAELMGVTVAAAFAEAGRLACDDCGAITVVSSSRDKARARTVVIERRSARRQPSAGLMPKSPASPAPAGPLPGTTTLRLPSRSTTGAAPR